MAPSDRPLRQVATRISPDAHETLEVLRLVEGAESMQELLRPVIEDFAARMGEDPEIAAIRTRVQAARDRRQGVNRLPTTLRKSRGRSSDATE
jgi:hypothetical protein